MDNVEILIFAGVAILVSLSAVVLNIISYRKIKRYLTDRKTDDGLDSDGNIRDEIVTVVLGSSRVREGLPKPQAVSEPDQKSDGISTETFNFIVETVLDEVNRKCAQKRYEPTLPMKETGCKYAEAYDLEAGKFYHIDTYPTDTTIYKLDLDEVAGDGTFTLYKGAYKKVSECRDFLEGACEVSGDGVTVEIISIGKLSLENGKWAIVKPLEVKFV